MENRLQTAIEQMKNREESGLNYIYSKTYNFVYLRAKSILKKDRDIRQLMKEVYLQAYESSDELKKENLYEWLGKHVYEIGCGFLKKKKEREAEFLEMERDELNPKRIENNAQSMEIICDVLEQLPDLYQATLFAFYYDYMKINEIAEVMGCSPKIIKNRLNYVRKYIKKAMEHYMEEHEGIKVAFSVEIVCNALREWSIQHCLGITTAQSVYSLICKEVELENKSIYLEGKEFAGVNNTIVYHKQDDLNMLQQEIIFHGKRHGMDRRNLVYAVGGGILLLVLIVGSVCLFKKPSEEKGKKNNTIVEKQEERKEKSEKKPKKEDKAEPKKEMESKKTSSDESNVNSDDKQKDKPSEENFTQPAEEEYIFGNSQKEILTEQEVWTKTKEELRLGRNEIYARYGVIFGVEDLDNYFKQKSWYQPKMSLSDFWDSVELSMTEEANVTLISEVEAQMQ